MLWVDLFGGCAWLLCCLVWFETCVGFGLFWDLCWIVGGELDCFSDLLCLGWVDCGFGLGFTYALVLFCEFGFCCLLI